MRGADAACIFLMWDSHVDNTMSVNKCQEFQLLQQLQTRPAAFKNRKKDSSVPKNTRKKFEGNFTFFGQADKGPKDAKVFLRFAKDNIRKKNAAERLHPFIRLLHHKQKTELKMLDD